MQNLDLSSSNFSQYSYSLGQHRLEDLRETLPMQYKKILEDYEKLKEYEPNVRHTLILESLLSKFDKSYSWLMGKADNYSDDEKAVISALEQALGEEMMGTILPAVGDIIRTEITDIINFINNKKKMEEKLENMDRKLDSILLGPDYEQGRNMMDSAKEDFESHL